jgi:hypothetical protein
MTVLLNNVDVDTDSVVLTSQGGPLYLNVRGDDYGGGTVTVEVRSMNDPDARWNAVLNATFTADFSGPRGNVPPGVQLRATLTGSTGASNVFAEVIIG